MKHLVTILLLAFTITINAQEKPSLEETLNWIKSKVEAYPSCGGICYEADVSIDLNKKEISINYLSNLNNRIIYTIPLRYLNSQGYSYTRNFLFTIKTHGNKVKKYEISSSGIRTTEYNSVAYLVFDDGKFQEENLEKRLKEAFNHACLLSGGTVTKEVF
ncbi:MAG: hypothetical protein JRJ57_04660 [Deltaproteobacteria bacterium]|nr:hypothetical protein [Deltaproteobacteria bacterium]